MAERKKITQISYTESAKTRFASPRAPTVQYDDELAEYICEQVAIGRSLLSVCREPNMPSAAAVIYWAQHNICGFEKKYALAIILRANIYAEELMEIADDCTNDWMGRENKDGSTYVVLNGEHIQRSSLRVKTRTWALSRLLPGTYGESLQLRHADNEGKKLPPPTLIIRPVRVAKPTDGV